jgi:ribosome-binding factor A
MARFRLQRVAQQMKQVIARVVTHELKDPRCGFLTITDVKVAADLKSARVRFSALGSDAQKRTVRRALDDARGYIQARVASETVLRYTPVISFELDESAEREIDLAHQIDRAVQADRRSRTARAIRARAAAGSVPPDVIDELDRLADAEPFRQSLAAFLADLVEIDTTSRPHVARAAADEARCFDRIEAELRPLWADEIEIERIPIEPEIAHDDAFTPLAYCDHLDIDKAYEGRANLVAILRHGPLDPAPDRDDDAPGSLRLAFNTHIDTIPPHVPPERRGDLLLGRGACDAKGQVATILAAFRLLRGLRDRLGLRLRNDLCAQFVIDEETGGNGSLSLAVQDPFLFDGIVVCEPTRLRIHTANRGAVWYRAELTAPPERRAELAAHIVLALEDEGRAIKAESDHPQFPGRPVQTNHGVLGPFGDAPCTVNGRIDLILRSDDLGAAEIEALTRSALADYCDAYGDKTAEQNPETGRSTLDRHITLAEDPDGALRLSVLGKAGHMGSLAECDNAITKAAYIVRRLAEARKEGAELEIAVSGHEGDALVLEGAQGFLPTHRLSAVAERLEKAARRGAEALNAAAGVEMSFDRLHNKAFAREPDSTLAVLATESARRAGIDAPDRPGGWEVSCDARLFAEGFPDRDVIVFGPGDLRRAHAPDECVLLRDLAAGAKMLAILILDAAGFVV